MARKQAVYTQQRCSAEMLGRDACFVFVADIFRPSWLTLWLWRLQT